jgi:hypothetical protein
LAVGVWPLAVGCWRLAVGCWLLAIGCWLLAVFTTPHFLTTPNTFLVEIQKVDLTLPHQVKRKKALLESNLSGLA